MDDRLWWFANRIQDVFQIGTYDSPTLLEDFISADETVEAINLFISMWNYLIYEFYIIPNLKYSMCTKPSTRDTEISQKVHSYEQQTF